MVIARSVRGMNDLFLADLAQFKRFEQALDQVTHAYGYQEIRTPILEELALFKRGVGETTDIVEKEMFTVVDGDHSYCLRPENTAPVVRALIERGVSEDTIEKLYYIGPMFRKERPQKGRLRQFHQFGFELFGARDAIADVEVIAMVDQLFKRLGLLHITLKINSLGDGDERLRYKEQLKEFFNRHLDALCDDCKRRIATNPLRVLDCKNAKCKAIAPSAPKIIESLGAETRAHFESVCRGLEEQGIAHEIDNFLVRGLDYYNRTVFEFVADIGLGAQNTIVGGGRYDGLFLTLGNKIDLPAIGCAGGIERIVLLLDQQETALSTTIACIGADDEGQRQAQKIAFALRNLGISADFSLVKKSVKAQMRRADKLFAQFVMVIGEQEVHNQRVTIKSLSTKSSQELPLDATSIAQFLSSKN